MKRLFAIAIFMTPALFAPACSQTSRICSLICDCEHCNDIVDDYRCESLSTSEDIANIYECGDQWTAYADCFEDKGTCDEDQVRFTTREPGSCSSTSSSGIQCMDNSDCLNVGVDGASCSNMVCVYPSCSGGNDQPCTSNADCPGGEDRCASETQALNECIAAASDDPQFVGN